MKIAVLFLISLFVTTMQAQDLNHHKWNNRVLVITINSSDTAALTTQLNDLLKQSDGCEERKLVIYSSTPSFTTFYDFKTEEGVSLPYDNKFYNRSKDVDNTFKISQIGLDGTIKETRNEPISSQELFSIIDGMYMRQAELRDKK